MSSVLTSEDSVISPPTVEESVVERVLYLDIAAIGVVHVGALYEYEMRVTPAGSTPEAAMSILVALVLTNTCTIAVRVTWS
ncbi:hypothetical protein GCK72_000238 [Caenorhabditis remanei]|uniref:Uncharacterized protein n=1 Tax=Caenorhabditis remanei TaxID=31234 RepID=A0A6A5HP35_CAERE|nr:hypothetical protein GCK72_000238 [Caenorhabditis remanei]KAF1768426.1 hypothetical protein GCK72_000238 [Caenorhabditis remanei]